MKKLLLIVPDGVAIRNYLYSSFINELQAKNVEVLVYHQISNTAVEEVKKQHPGLTEIKTIPYFIEKPVARLLRESTAYARLLINKKKLNNPTVMAFWNRNQKSVKQQLLYLLAELLGTLFAYNYGLLLKMEGLYDKKINKAAVLNAINKDLELWQPDYVLNLHQRVPVSAPIISVAKKRNICTGTVIFSWDNVPKARLISRYNFYFVWSATMKEELSILYPELDKRNIIVSGTPQFEFYFNEHLLIDKEAFFLQNGLNSTKKTICFSANDLSSPYEANYLADICDEVSKMGQENRPQILFRRCPVDRSARFDTILEKYKGLLFPINPDWRIENKNEDKFASIYPSVNDLSLLVNTVKHSDVVINLGSTMAHDFAVYDKTCLYLNYNPIANSVFKVEMIYKFQHFKTMEGLNPVGWINSKQQIKEIIDQALTTPTLIGKDRTEWLKRVVQYPLADSSKNLANKIIASCTSFS